MPTRYLCFYCGRRYPTREQAIRCHDAPIQEVEDHPNPPKIRWWAGR